MYNNIYPPLEYHKSSFTALKILHVLFFITPPPPLAPNNTDLFTISIGLSFPQCRVVGIIQYIAFQTGFFHLAMFMSVSETLNKYLGSDFVMNKA